MLDQNKFSKTTVYALSILSGLLCLVFSVYNIEYSLRGLKINIPWSIIFPIIVVLAYGFRAVFASAFSGAILYPLLLWPNNGYAHLVDLFSLLLLLSVLGGISDFKKKNRPFNTRFRVVSLVALAFVLLYILLYRYVFAWLLQFNPAFWSNEPLLHLSAPTLHAIIAKNLINFLLTIIFADALLQTPQIRNLLGLPTYPWMKYNLLIFLSSIASAIGVWLFFYLLDSLLVPKNTAKEYLLLSFFVMFWSGGIIGLALIYFSEHKQKYELQLQKVFDNSPSVIVMLNKNKLIQKMNNTGLHVFGLKLHQVKHNEFCDLFLCHKAVTTHQSQQNLHHASPNHCRAKQVIQDTLATGKSYSKIESVHWLKDKEQLVKPYYFLLSTARIDYGLEKMILVTLDDISSLKAAEFELKQAKDKAEENELRLKIAQVASNSGAWDWDIANDKFEWSEELLQLLGLAQKKREGSYTSWRSCIHPEDLELVDQHMQKALTQQQDLGLDYRIIKHNKEVRWIRIYGKTAFENNQAVRMTGLCIDVSAAKKNEFDLIRAKEKAEENDRLKTAFLQNMSHEIRTPMNGIKGFSELLTDATLPAEDIKYYTRIIQNSSNQLLRVIDDILEISTLETKQVKLRNSVFNLNDFLDELHAVFELKVEEKNMLLFLKKALPDANSFVKTDEVKLAKILNNLLDNALKFTPTGFIEFGYTLLDHSVQIYVKDTGIGIARENHKKVFERFSQEDKNATNTFGGLGLGLSIAKENAELIGGTVSLESKKGYGATFSITIPFELLLHGQPVFPQHVRTPQPAPNLAGYTILIAEDEEVNYLYIELLLLEYSHNSLEIIRAKTGLEAVQLFKSKKKIDLVFMDVKMPQLNGLEATKIIKTIEPTVPIIAQTAYTTESEHIKALDAGCDDFISKPIDNKALLRLLGKYLVSG